MCNFKSALYFKNGDLIHSDVTDSHEDLVLVSGLKDNILSLDRVVRVECVPPSDIDDIADLSKWILKLDEPNVPSWWAKKKDDCERKMLAIIKNSIVTDERKCLLGGCWILTKTAKVHKMVGGRILIAVGANLENANLGYAYLRNANLRNANLENANLEKANLWNANLGYANLGGANLENANLGDANLYNANLENANLYNARRLSDDKPIKGWRKINGRLRPYNPGKKK